MKIKAEQVVSSEDAKLIMEERKKNKELVYEQRICDEYLERTSRLTASQLSSIKEELEKITILNSRYISIIINILPETEEEVEALFMKERTTLKKEEIKQIAEIVSKYAK